MPERRVLVTGSSRGIGRAIAVRLANDGWSVGIHYGSDKEDADHVRDLLGKRCVGIFEADLSVTSNAAKLFSEFAKEGPVHAIVNNAGIYMPLDFLGSGDAAFAANLHRTIATNFESPTLLMRAAGKYFAKHGGGKIVNVASRVGFKGEGGAALYAASKAALINMTRSLAVELAGKNIGVFGIAPGWVETAMAREGMEQRKKEIVDSIPLGRIATPDDCAAAAAFLLSDDASYLSGIVIDINGASYFH
ncbi:MAG TPA: SDR family NAD(P)-dependent oxidoreductase [Fimbriimonadaceae bacterium]|nr:SDR family NAD(P)-dependent oxidoreductase [Fimbriimonadaceae bacterium]